MKRNASSMSGLRGKPLGYLSIALFFALSFSTIQTAMLLAGDDAALSQVLKQMEVAGRSFRTFHAQFSQRKYTAVLNEFDTTQSGEFFYARAKEGSALLRQEITKPARQILTIKGGLATIYQPALNQAQIYNLGKNKDKAEYLALGLGQTPGKLRETFDIKYQGVERLNGAPCSVLALKPRSTAAAAFFSTITLWIKKSNGVPIQQKLLEPNGDYLLVKFTDESLNTQISPSRFEQKLASNVEILRVQ